MITTIRKICLGKRIELEGLGEFYLKFFELLQINQTIWDLEDLVRSDYLSISEKVSIKSQIDQKNQSRNDEVSAIDQLLEKTYHVQDRHDYSKLIPESPGMTLDKLTIISIRLKSIKQIISLLTKNKPLLNEYKGKYEIVLSQLEDTLGYLKYTFKALKLGEIYFKSYQPVKIYNDSRIRQYIDSINNKNH